MKKGQSFPTLLPLASLLFCSSAVLADQASPWQFDGHYRLRYESLQNAYRANAHGDDSVLASQLLASLKYQGENLLGQVELEDARTWLDDSGTPLGSDDVNTLEPLQAWLGWHDGDKWQVRVGRQTLDIGSRRLMARQRFRNTINPFDGIYGSYNDGFATWQGFYFNPVTIRPDNRQDLDHNKTHLDKESNDHVWGLDWNHKGATDLELYYYGTDSNRGRLKLSTLGFRNLNAIAANQWYYEVEAAYQFGDNGDLDVNAGMFHGQIGYQFDDALASRLSLLADYASGDSDPNDGKSQRFNTLFGVSRFDFGPTGIYGAFARTNIISPGVQWDFKPAIGKSAFIAYRAVWLASAHDSQSRSGLRDTSGDSGRFVGHQIEARWRIDLMKQLQLEIGGAYLIKGEFFRDAPSAPDDGNTSYFYTQATYKF